MKFATILLLVAVASLTSVQRSAAQPFNEVVVFGDSNVDSGFFKALPNPGGSASFNALWADAVAHGAGAPTTGPGLMNSQFLASYFGLAADPSNTAGGTNYATSSSKNVTVNDSQTGGFQEAIPTVTQISNYLIANSGVANGGALFFIHSGDNDVSYANQEIGAGPFPPDPDAYVTGAANDLATAINSLKTAGAQHIIVAGLAYDYPGNDAAKMALKLLYTNTLWNQLDTLGVEFYRGDIDQVRLAISANPARYGFSSISNASGQVGCTQPAGIGTAWALLCSSDSEAPSTLVDPAAPRTHLFADNQHLGTSGQRLMANYLYNLVIPPTVTHDFGGDGRSDIAWRNTDGNTAIWFMGGAEVAATASFGMVPNSWSIVGQRDFNADGRFDWLWRDSDGTLAIWFLHGPQIGGSAVVGTVPPAWSVAATADFNADHAGDIVWRENGGDVAIWLMKGSQIFQSAGLGNVPTTWAIAGTGDFSGDGKSDILWRDDSGNVAIWFIAGTQLVNTASVGNVPIAWNIVGTGDFDGDGKSDIVWRDTSGNTAIWQLDGAQVTQTVSLGLIPPNWSIAATGDFNADGKSDLLWRDTTGGTVAIWFMNGGQVAGAAAVATLPPDWIIQGLNAD